MTENDSTRKCSTDGKQKSAQDSSPTDSTDLTDSDPGGVTLPLLDVASDREKSRPERWEAIPMVTESKSAPSSEQNNSPRPLIANETHHQAASGGDAHTGHEIGTQNTSRSLELRTGRSFSERLIKDQEDNDKTVRLDGPIHATHPAPSLDPMNDIKAHFSTDTTEREAQLPELPETTEQDLSDDADSDLDEDSDGDQAAKVRRIIRRGRTPSRFGIPPASSSPSPLRNPLDSPSINGFFRSAGSPRVAGQIWDSPSDSGSEGFRSQVGQSSPSDRDADEHVDGAQNGEGADSKSDDTRATSPNADKAVVDDDQEDLSGGSSDNEALLRKRSAADQAQTHPVPDSNNSDVTSSLPFHKDLPDHNIRPMHQLYDQSPGLQQGTAHNHEPNSPDHEIIQDLEAELSSAYHATNAFQHNQCLDDKTTFRRLALHSVLNEAFNPTGEISPNMIFNLDFLTIVEDFLNRYSETIWAQPDSVHLWPYREPVTQYFRILVRIPARTDELRVQLNLAQARVGSRGSQTLVVTQRASNMEAGSTTAALTANTTAPTLDTLMGNSAIASDQAGFAPPRNAALPSTACKSSPIGTTTKNTRHTPPHAYLCTLPANDHSDLSCRYLFPTQGKLKEHMQLDHDLDAELAREFCGVKSRVWWR